MPINDEDSGPAFPVDLDNHDRRGMSLRDYFAGKALNAILQSRAYQFQTGDDDYSYVAGFAYDVADAMLEERKHDTE